MTVSPELLAVIGALVTVVGLYYRSLLSQIAEEKREAEFWRDKALGATGLAELATDEADRRKR